jgi:hypothetical protein
MRPSLYVKFLEWDATIEDKEAATLTLLSAMALNFIRPFRFGPSSIRTKSLDLSSSSRLRHFWTT